MRDDPIAPGIVIRAPDKTSARESGDEARLAGWLAMSVSLQECGTPS